MQTLSDTMKESLIFESILPRYFCTHTFPKQNAHDNLFFFFFLIHTVSGSCSTRNTSELWGFLHDLGWYPPAFPQKRSIFLKANCLTILLSHFEILISMQQHWQIWRYKHVKKRKEMFTIRMWRSSAEYFH